MADTHTKSFTFWSIMGIIVMMLFAFGYMLITRPIDENLGLQKFKRHLEEKTELEGVWGENGRTYYSLGTSGFLYKEVICKAESSPKQISIGVVVEAKELEPGYWHLVIKD